MPWNLCGAYVSATLGIATFAYLPFWFFNLINPLVSFGLAATGRGIERAVSRPDQPADPTGMRIHGVGGQTVAPLSVPPDG